jgi:alpha-1,2-mannosyltransferase
MADAERPDGSGRWAAVIAGLAAGFGLFSAGAILWVMPHEPGVIFIDFFMIWSSARFVLENGLAGFWGPSLQEFQSALLGVPHGYHPFPYPPPFLFFVLPLGFLSYFVAYFLFIGTTGAAYLAGAAGRRPHPVMALALLAAPAALCNALYGHNGFLTAGLLAGGVRLLGARPALAGILFGLLAYKPQLALAIPVALVAAGAWRALAASAATALGLALASVAVFGIGPWLDWLAFMPGFSERVLANGDVLFWKMASLAPALLRVGLPFPVAMAAQIAVGLAAIVVLWIVFRRAAARPAAGALLLVIPFLVTPYSYAYDVPSTAIAVAWLVAEGARRGARLAERIVLAAAWLAPLAAIFELPPALAPVVPLAYIALEALAAARALRPGPGGAPAVSRP